MNGTVFVPLEKINPNRYQGRKMYTDIDVLARTIATNGLDQLPKARMLVDGAVELKFGHRRFEAFKWLRENFQAENLPERFDGYTVMPLVVEEMTDVQLYEGMVIENAQRQDLNDIEKALVIREYRTTFGKTSAEAGAMLGMSDATVRGIERFLELPALAQKALAGKKITQGTARLLLSAQRLGGEAVVKELLKGVLSDHNDNLTPEDIIEHEVDHLKNTVDMWGGYRSNGNEKPRAGRGLWLLDMKKFPNKMLPALLLSDLVMVGIVAAKDDANQTMAMRYIKGEDTYVPEEIKVKIDNLVNPPACTACPFYAVMNKSHYCGLKACHERKAIAFKAQKIADLVRMVKIPIYAPADGGYLVLDESMTSHKKAFEARHADLRLLPADQFKGYAWQRFIGLDSDTVKLVAVGSSADNLAVAGWRGKKTGGKKSEKEKAEIRAMRLYRKVRLELMWEYSAAAQVIFEGVPMEALKKLRGWHNIMIDDRIPEEHERNPGGDKLEYQRRDLVWRLIMESSSHFTRCELMNQLKRFQAITQVAPPKSLVKHAQEWDAEIAALARPVAVETKAVKK